MASLNQRPSTDEFAVYDPADGSVVGMAQEMDANTLDLMVGNARRAFSGWREQLPVSRRDALRRWAEIMRGRKEEFAQLMTREQGKPIAESRGEIDYGLGFIEWFAEEGVRPTGEILAPHLSGSQGIVQQIPIGVAALITPWNFPFAMIARKASAALAAGCTAIVKPSPETPLTALAMEDAAHAAGLPEGVFSVATSETAALSEQLVAHRDIGVISFTGSTAVGQKILSSAAAGVKRVLLELGGHAPFIVLDDADIDRAVQDAVGAKFTTGGQDCLAVNRFFVPETLRDTFVERFVAATRKLQVGRGIDPQTAIGPMTTAAQAESCREQIRDAVDQGAQLAFTGTAPSGNCWLAPTILTGVTDEMRIAREETFGPVAAISTYSEIGDVIGHVNRSRYGLAAYVHGGDLDRATRVAQQLDYGMIAINTARMTGPPVPFGGMRQSGLGREGARHGLIAFTETRYLCICSN
ncbi:NAD-dependent succinate-semialdehyde dehydrogenase [Tsuneonella suprasediminis]|uniref:NAD-dependent succinate-semialdehyde dehydrogenase n=1 Tax=Tsuneonella suprasediminis TaxID=2306996 RepID=A0A419R1X3_9SPHN|nr:NAD-dependent succinate-semialdehyde dehydrogenase [Tsuneonella suprasediminis]RJX67921.1 NAD-dependent succinate-semialdehyde dehydrogenase [Tsuneonella suprasediminis]